MGIQSTPCSRAEYSSALSSACYLSGQMVEVDAVLAASYRQDRQVREPGRAGQADVGGRDREQHIPFAGAQRAQRDVHRFLESDGDHDGLRVGAYSFVPVEMPRD